MVTSAFSQTYREINKTLPLKPDGKLIIDTYKGTISITTHHKPQVEVYVKIESDNNDTEEADQEVKETEIDFQNADDEVVIHTDYSNVERSSHHDFWDWLSDPQGSSNILPLVHYTIKMPQTADLKIKDYKSVSRIGGLHSTLTFNTYKGTVDISDLTGGIDLETYKGDVNISYSSLKDDSHFETYKGNITVSVPRQTGFELRTEFGRRVEFNTDFDVETRERDRKHHQLDYFGKINGGGPLIHLNSEKGEIRLRSK